jgi:signal peptidase
VREVKRILKYLENLIIGTIITVMLLSVYTSIMMKINSEKISYVMGYKPLTVLSGSMDPYIKAGDMIIVKRVNPENIKVNDVITYIKDDNIFVTHRVVEKNIKEERLAFRTKGDINNVEDKNLVFSEKVVGISVFKIPYGGYFMQFMRSKKVLILIFFIMALTFLERSSNASLRE